MNLVCNVMGIYRTGDVFQAHVQMLTENGLWADPTLEMPYDTLLGNASQINAAIIAAAKQYVADNHGIVIGGGDKVTLLGAAV